MTICGKIVHGNHVCARRENHEGDCMCHWDQQVFESEKK